MPPAAGLRAWKKERTRQTISDVATGLFMRDGFEAVTVRDIAAAAEVSVKTVFNYFPSKEDLFFDRAEDVIGALTAAVVERGDQTIVAAVHAHLADRAIPFDPNGWAFLNDPTNYERFRKFLATEEASPALQARRLAIGELWSARLAQCIAHQLDLKPGDPRATTLANFIIATMNLRARTLTAAMMERLSTRTVEKRVRAVVDEALTRLARAYEDVDRPAIPEVHG